MKSKSQFKQDDDAVSPVIGVILMVAITVILAAVIGTFVLDLGSQVDTNIQAGATVKADASADTITVTWTSNQNAENLTVNLNGTEHSNSPLQNVGESVQFNGSSTPSVTDGAEHHIIVTATKGAQSTVIVDTHKTL